MCYGQWFELRFKIDFNLIFFFFLWIKYIGGWIRCLANFSYNGQLERDFVAAINSIIKFHGKKWICCAIW